MQADLPVLVDLGVVVLIAHFVLLAGLLVGVDVGSGQVMVEGLMRLVLGLLPGFPVGTVLLVALLLRVIAGLSGVELRLLVAHILLALGEDLLRLLLLLLAGLCHLLVEALLPGIAFRDGEERRILAVRLNALVGEGSAVVRAVADYGERCRAVKHLRAARHRHSHLRVSAGEQRAGDLHSGSCRPAETAQGFGRSLPWRARAGTGCC